MDDTNRHKPKTKHTEKQFTEINEQKGLEVQKRGLEWSEKEGKEKEKRVKKIPGKLKST
jgi:hypothetical protein